MSDSEIPVEERRLVLARHFISVGQPGKALEILRQGGFGEGENPESWLLRGRALVLLERYEEAATVLERGLSFDPEATELLYLLAFAEKLLGRLATAERHLLQALRIAPHSAHLLAEYASLVARAGQFEKARALLARAEEADPESPSVPRVRSFLATLEGRDRDAAKHARDLVAEQPDDAHAHVLAAQTLHNLGRPEAGFRHAREAVTLDARVADGQEEWLREQRLHSHWAMIPLRPLSRYGPGVIWAGAMVVLVLLRSAGWSLVAGGFAVLYLSFALYSWIAPPILRRVLRRRWS